MSCKLCDFTLEENERKITTSYFDEKYWLEYDNNTYNLVVEYDCGYAYQTIEDIKYCPLCGKKLSNE